MPDTDVMYCAGQFVPQAEARVSALDAGLLLGAGLFETLRTYGGRPFRLRQHLARLRESGTFLRVFVGETDARIAEIVDRLVKENGVPEARVRITATRGPVGPQLDDDEAPRATLLVTAGPMTPYPAELYDRGCTVVVSDIFVGETDARIAEIVDRLVKENGVPEARVRITATRGPVGPQLDDDEAPRATLLVTAGPMTPYPAELYDRGCTVVVSDIRANETDPVVFHKTTNFMRSLLALRDAHRAQATEALLFNSRNRLAEGALSNVFLVKGGRLLTPPVEDGLMPGITRAAVLELAAEIGGPAEQRSLTVHDLLDADEVFLTNSIMEILPVGRIEQHDVGPKDDPDRLGKPGPVTRRLAEAYKALVARETGA